MLMELGRIGRLDVVRDEEDIVDELYRDNFYANNLGLPKA
jgi:hypothetical protein